MRIYIEKIISLQTARPLVMGHGSVVEEKHADMWIEFGLLYVQLKGKNSHGKTEPLRCFHPAGVEMFPRMLRDEASNQTDVPWTPQAEADAGSRAGHEQKRKQQEQRS